MEMYKLQVNSVALLSSSSSPTSSSTSEQQPPRLLDRLEQSTHPYGTPLEISKQLPLRYRYHQWASELDLDL